jgi:phosphohistidine phosphatase SixA
MRTLAFLFCCFSLWITACSRTYYVVRYAEKLTPGNQMNTDVLLSEAGLKRAETLKDSLMRKKTAYIFCTNTARTKATAAPLATQLMLPITLYGPKPDSLFIRKLLKLKKNTLVVGHSNTVDDIVNGLCFGDQLVSDLNEKQYNELFIVKVNKGLFGRTYSLKQTNYGHELPVQ